MVGIGGSKTKPGRGMLIDGTPGKNTGKGRGGRGMVGIGGLREIPGSGMLMLGTPGRNTGKGRGGRGIVGTGGSKLNAQLVIS